MEADILCSLLTQRLGDDPKKFEIHGQEVVFYDHALGRTKPADAPNESPFNTPENQKIVADVIANYDTLAAILINNNAIKEKIDALESQQTPRRIREALHDNSWMLALESQIAALRAQLK